MQLLILLSLSSHSCAPRLTTQQPDFHPEMEIAVPLTSTPSPVSRVQLPDTDKILFTILNPEPFYGREGEARPDWLGWGAGTFTAAPDGSFWIADTAVFPNRLLHYSPLGEQLQAISLENLVVYVFDLAVAQDSLWLLDISAQPPKIVQLDMEGNLQSNVKPPRGTGTVAGQSVSNGAFDLFTGEQDELYLLTLSGYYEIVDESGKNTGQPVTDLEYFGHTYRAGVYNEAVRSQPIFVDGTLFDMEAGFFVEMSFLGFRPDGSFALAGWVEDAEHQAERQVRYYAPTGNLVGAARQQPQTFYRDWNHHLAVGPDESVYQLLSNPDHSVQILLLGFYEGPVPLSSPQPAFTSTPMAVLQPSGTGALGVEQARDALLTFFSALEAGAYEEAAVHFGGEEIEYARERTPD